jgi:AcrR family transcriptional regulator
MTQQPDDTSRSRILDAAEEAFAEHGLAGARVAAIADAAGANKAMVYYWFNNKQALYTAVLERVFEQIASVAEAFEQSPSGDPIARIERFARGYNAVLQGHPRIERILLRAMLDDQDALFELMAPRVRRVIPRVATEVISGQAQGTVNASLVAPLLPASIAAPFVFFALARPLLQRLTGLPGDTLNEAWQAHVLTLLIDGIRGRTEAP